MDDSAVKSVVHELRTARVNSNSKAEVDGTRRALDLFSWEMVVQKAATLCGLTVSEALLSPITPLPNSHAANLGHDTLESLVSKQEKDYGLGLDWPDFQRKAKALVYRMKYAMSDSGYEDIIEQIDQATALIGRLPGDATEFHNAKQRALNENIVEMRRDYTAKLEKSQSANAELIRNLDRANGEVVELKSAQKTLQQDSAERIQRVTREMAVRAEQLEQDAADALVAERQRLEADFIERSAAERAVFEGKIQEAVIARQAAESAVDAYKHRVDSGELVEASVLAGLNDQLEKARSAEEAIKAQLLELNDQLTQSHQRIELMREEGEIYQRTVADLNTQISQLESRMRELVEEKSGTAEFAVLHERLEIRKREVEKLRDDLTLEMAARQKAENSLARLSGKYQQMKTEGATIIGRLRKQVSDLNVSNKLTADANGALQIENGQVKVALGMSAFVGVLLTASLVMLIV